jgi:hypothetical protein
LLPPVTLFCALHYQWASRLTAAKKFGRPCQQHQPSDATGRRYPGGSQTAKLPAHTIALQQQRKAQVVFQHTATCWLHAPHLHILQHERGTQNLQDVQTCGECRQSESSLL